MKNQYNPTQDLDRGLDAADYDAVSLSSSFKLLLSFVAGLLAGIFSTSILLP